MPKSNSSLLRKKNLTNNLREVAEGRDLTWSQTRLKHLSWCNASAFLRCGVIVCRNKDAEVFLGVQMLQQLFECEMCMRETKNRMRTPLSQLPSRCLWDCLCISPLSSFSLFAFLLFFCRVAVVTPPFSVFLLFWGPESSLCVCGQSCVPIKARKQDTAPSHYCQSSKKLAHCHTAGYWKCARPMSVEFSYFGSSQKFHSPLK